MSYLRYLALAIYILWYFTHFWIYPQESMTPYFLWNTYISKWYHFIMGERTKQSCQICFSIQHYNKRSQQLKNQASYNVRCPLEDIYFMWAFYFLFLLLTAVGMFHNAYLNKTLYRAFVNFLHKFRYCFYTRCIMKNATLLIIYWCMVNLRYFTKACTLLEMSLP